MEDKEKEKGEVSRRDFLVGAGAVVVGGAIGAGITYPLVSGDGEVSTVTKTVSVPTTVTSTKTVGDGMATTVTDTVTTTVGAGGVEPAFEPEETFLQMINPMGFGGEVSAIEVKNGKIVRIRPLHYDEMFTQEELAPAIWKIEAHGKSLEPRMTAATGYLQSTYKKRVYSPNRILYPLQRVDWEPGGDPAKINSQNRGISKFKRISWDEATDIVASEIKRIADKYGPYGLMTIAEYIHGESKNVQGHGGCHTRLMSESGGYTRETRATGSVCALYWGAKHVWGEMSWGGYSPNPTTLDIATNTEMIVSFGGDYETHEASKSTQMSRVMYWLFKELGVKHISVDPRLNYSAAVWADKWIPILPSTDAALQLGILYTWISEGTYDQAYLDTHAVGFDELKAYVMGDEDGEPKTPEWASERCGVPEWTIKALARAWASKTTTLGLSWSGQRAPYCTEYARLQACELGMQGLGKPGVHSFFKGSMPSTIPLNTYAGGRTVGLQDVPQQLPKGAVAEGILNPPISYYALGSWLRPVETQFQKWTYPIPEEEGGTEIHMLWDESACHTSCYCSGFRYIEAARSPKIECYVIQHQWLEDDCILADILLPVSTALEQRDILASGSAFKSMVLHKQTIAPIGEGKSDYVIAGEIAKKLEKYGGRYADAYNKYTGGKSVEEWIKFAFDNSGAQDKISWEEFSEKGIYIAPIAPDWKEQKSGIIDFYQDPVANPLTTPSGKLEFYSERIAELFPDDNERGPLPKWVVGGPAAEGWTHDERLGGERAKTYPLLLLDPIRRWGHHSQFSDVPWFAEIPTARVKGYDGYMYEPVWMHPKTAAERGIESGDIVKIYNDRGTVLAGAYVTERLIPGAIQTEHGCRLDPIGDKIDRGGLSQLMSPDKGVSKNCRVGMCVSGFLVEAEKLDPSEMEEWRKQYPEAFARDYDPGYGVIASGWIEGGM